MADKTFLTFDFTETNEHGDEWWDMTLPKTKDSYVIKRHWLIFQSLDVAIRTAWRAIGESASLHGHPRLIRAADVDWTTVDSKTTDILSPGRSRTYHLLRF